MDWNKFNELTLLIIDDDQFTRELVRTLLKEKRGQYLMPLPIHK